MKAPLSWLKDYVDIKSKTADLMWKMTEIGLTCESYEEVAGDKVLDIEVTPNRPDWLSITGVAREIAITQSTLFKLPKIPEIPKPSADLPIKIRFDNKLTGGYAGITIGGVEVKESPSWIKDKLTAVGLRPINNLVDITNYVMFELGIPIHVFDYDKFLDKNLTMTLSDGGEKFVSVDELEYKLPKDTLIIKDGGRVVDLCGIKGGANTGISPQTKNIFIHAPVYDGAYIRKTSQALKLSSDASYIYERGPSPLGIEQTLKRVVSLVLELAGGNIASKPIYKIDNDKSSKITLDFNHLASLMGTHISKKDIINILQKLEFQPTAKNDEVVCVVPYFRSDIAIIEDVYEEIARIWGYNNFDRTLPDSGPSDVKIPYAYNREFELQIKDFLVASGFFETSSGALTSKATIEKSNLNLDLHIRIANPVSGEYEFMRTSLVPSLISAIKANTESNISLFEYGKVYYAPVDKATEVYKVSAAVKGGSFESLKGIVDLTLQKLNIEKVEIKPFTLTNGLWHPTRAGVMEKDGEQIGVFGEINTKVLRNYGLKDKVYGLEMDIATLAGFEKKYIFKRIPKFPPQIEDLTVSVSEGVITSGVIETIKAQKFVLDVEFVNIYKNNLTVRIYYSSPDKTLDNNEVGRIRKSLVEKLKKKFIIKIEN